MEVVKYVIGYLTYYHCVPVGFGDITPVTVQGRLVVILSILAGVAIIPAQAASLAEAYLGEDSLCIILPSSHVMHQLLTSLILPLTDFQKERTMGKKRPKKVGPENMKRNQLCTNCGSGPHRSDAFFCWNCGETLSS